MTLKTVGSTAELGRVRSRWGWLAVVCTLIVTASVITTQGAQQSANAAGPVPDTPSGLIAFTVTAGTSTQVWVMERDGSNRRRLTSGDRDSMPRWSPTGRQLMFTREFSYAGWYWAWNDALQDWEKVDTQDTATAVYTYDIGTGAETPLVVGDFYDPEGIMGPIAATTGPNQPSGLLVDVVGLYWLPDESGVYAEWSYRRLPLNLTVTRRLLGTGPSFVEWPGHSSASFTCPGGTPPVPPPGGYGRVVGRQHPDPDANLMAFTASGQCSGPVNRVAVGSGIGGTTAAQMIVVTYPVSTGAERFAGWASDGAEILVEGPAAALWRVPASGGTATAITTPHTVSTPWSFQRVYLSGNDCYGLFSQAFGTGSGGSATSSTDDLIVVQQGELSEAANFPGRPEPVPGGRWCNTAEMPAGRHGLFRTTVADGVTVPLHLETTSSTAPRNADIQCRPGSCLTAVRLVKSTVTDLSRPGTYPTDFLYTAGAKTATLTVAGNPFEQPVGPARTVRLTPGAHVVTESPALGWTLTDLRCEGVGAATTSVETGSATVELPAAGGILMCTFVSTADLGDPVVDTDEDGIPDDEDPCPNDPTNTCDDPDPDPDPGPNVKCPATTTARGYTVVHLDADIDATLAPDPDFFDWEVTAAWCAGSGGVVVRTHGQAGVVTLDTNLESALDFFGISFEWDSSENASWRSSGATGKVHSSTAFDMCVAPSSLLPGAGTVLRRLAGTNVAKRALGSMPRSGEAVDVMGDVRRRAEQQVTRVVAKLGDGVRAAMNNSTVKAVLSKRWRDRVEAVAAQVEAKAWSVVSGSLETLAERAAQDWLAQFAANGEVVIPPGRMTEAKRLWANVALGLATDSASLLVSALEFEQCVTVWRPILDVYIPRSSESFIDDDLAGSLIFKVTGRVDETRVAS